LERSKPRSSFRPALPRFPVTPPALKLRAARTATVPSEDVHATAPEHAYRARRWRAESADVDGIFDPLADHDTGGHAARWPPGSRGAARAAVVARGLGTVMVRRGATSGPTRSALELEVTPRPGGPGDRGGPHVNATPSARRGGPGLPRERRGEPSAGCVSPRRGRPTGDRIPPRARPAARQSKGLRMFAAQASARRVSSASLTSPRGGRAPARPLPEPGMTRGDRTPRGRAPAANRRTAGRISPRAQIDRDKSPVARVFLSDAR
jgi:hypothetical protein